jgi:hypothetical protein
MNFLILFTLGLVLLIWRKSIAQRWFEIQRPVYEKFFGGFLPLM